MRFNQSGATAARDSLNEGHNKSPISGLPVELLLHIFRLLWDISKPYWSRFELRMERDHSTGSEYIKYGPCKRKGQKSVATIRRPADEFKLTYRDLLGWIVVTHVCRLWREVAVQRPSFWSKIESGRLEWEKIFVDRSLGSPTLSIFAHAAIDDNSPLIAESLPRMLDLTLAGRAVSSASKHFTKAAPKLASLRVQAHGLGWHGDPSKLKFSTVFETGLSASFHELSVSNIALSANSPLLSPHLTTLELVGERTSSSFSVDEFIPALRRMSCLQVLKLRGALRSYSEDQSLTPFDIAEPVIKLLHLKELHLTTYTVDIYNHFMLRVELNPQITHLRVVFDLTRGTDRYVTSLLPSCIISSDSQPRLVRTLLVNIISPDIFSVSVWPTLHLERLFESGMLLSARIVHTGLTFLQALSLSFHLGPRCNKPFPLHTIQALFVGTVFKGDVQHTTQMPQWLPILEKMPALECITVLTNVNDLDEMAVIEYLAKADPFPCPMLSRLDIQRTASVSPERDARFYGGLASLFERRSEDLKMFVNGQSLSYSAVKDRKASCETKSPASYMYAQLITDLA